MLDKLFAFLSGAEAPELGPGGKDVEIAVAALLVEAARMDNRFEGEERATIERLLASRFGLAPEAVHELVTTAEQRIADTAQYYPFTREICLRMSREERIEVLEMLWKVAYADGRLDPFEDALLRQVAGLIHVADRERGLARQRALAELDSTGPSD